MTSETILKQERDRSESERVKALVQKIESLYPAKNSFFMPKVYRAGFKTIDSYWNYVDKLKELSK